jgi:tyrosyl-tRNA synthetase
MHVLDHLKARGFLQTHTDLDALKAHMDAGPVTFYVGFDPTADSLHIGHLLPVMAMAWLQEAGHRPLAIVGGGTGLIGDPSGKTKTRDMLDDAAIQRNLEGQKAQLKRFLRLADHADRAADGEGLVLNNADWLTPLNYIAFLRDVGRQFSVNRMLTAEGMRQRIDRNQGLSFVEFNYHLLQSYDFLVLNQQHGCTLQLGGDDQWFNILGGVDLIRRVEGASAHALTVPLIMTADGKKMGKTEAGAVFLDAAQVSPYDYHQYWLNVHDADVGRMLRLYTKLPIAEIEPLEALDGPQIRVAKARLAWEATALVHGAAEADKARDAAAKAFSGGVSADMPTITAALPAPVVELLVQAELASSKSEARRFVKGGGVRIDDDKVSDIAATLDHPAVLWRGKKKAVRVVEG